MYKNVEKQVKLNLSEQVDYQPGQVVSKTLVQNDPVSMTLFAFGKDEEISMHESSGGAIVTVLEALAALPSAARSTYLKRAKRLSCLRAYLMPCTVRSASRCSWLYHSNN